MSLEYEPSSETGYGDAAPLRASEIIRRVAFDLGEVCPHPPLTASRDDDSLSAVEWIRHTYDSQG